MAMKPRNISHFEFQFKDKSETNSSNNLILVRKGYNSKIQEDSSHPLVTIFFLVFSVVSIITAMSLQLLIL